MTPHSAILIAFASDAASVRTSVYMLFSQVLPILLAITASIGNSSLTLFDVKYGISLTASPVSIYVGYSAARELLGIHNSLFERLGHTRRARTTDSSDGECHGNVKHQRATVDQRPFSDTSRS